MIWAYPPEVHEFVKEHAKYMRDPELAEACNQALGTSFTASTMKSFRGNHGYRNMLSQWSSEEYWRYQTKWPKGMYEYIRDNSWGVSSKEMAERVNELFGTNFTQNRMKSFRAKYKIRSGLTGWFRKGRAPGNKGKKQSEYCSPEAIERSKASQFQKGHVPANQMQVGEESITADGYRVVKVSMKGSEWERWKFVHRKVWEEHYGKIPEGYVIIFRDGNKLNCDISNLLMVKRSELGPMAKKGYLSEDPDVTTAGHTLIKLMQAAKAKRGTKDGEKTETDTGEGTAGTGRTGNDACKDTGATET